jgi:hypothetical protein
MAEPPSGSATPSVGDLVAAVTRSAEAAAEADRRRPPPGAMTFPRPPGLLQGLMGLVMLLMLGVAGLVAGVGWALQSGLVRETAREVGPPPPPPPFPAALLADDTTWMTLLADHPRRAAEILADRAGALVAAGRPDAALDTLAMLEARGHLPPRSAFDRTFALAALGRPADALLAARTVDGAKLEPAERSRLAALVERLVLGRPGQAGHEQHVQAVLDHPTPGTATEAAQPLDAGGGTHGGDHHATGAHAVEQH